MPSVNAGVCFYEPVVRQHKKPRSSKTATEITLGILIMPLRHRLMCKNNREWMLCILTHKTYTGQRFEGTQRLRFQRGRTSPFPRFCFIVLGDKSESFANALRNSHQFTRLSPGFFLHPFNFCIERFALSFVNSICPSAFLTSFYTLSLLKKPLSTST